MKLKKILSLLVVLTLACSLFTAVNVNAAEDEFAILRTLGISTDFSDNTTPITRYQLAQVALELTGISAEPNGEPVFPDIPVKHKYFPVVNAAYINGLMGALTDGSFGPDTNATAMDAGRVLLSELGYTAFAKQANWTDAQYNSKVQSLGLMRGIDSSKGLTYHDVGKMIINMFTTKVMDIIAIDGEGIKFAESNLTYIESRFGYILKTGIMYAAGSASASGYAPVKANQVIIDDILYKTDGRDYSKYVGYNVKYIVTSEYEDGQVIHVEKYRDYEEVVISAKDVLGYDNYVMTYVDENGSQEKLTLGTSARVIINGQNMGAGDVNFEKYFTPDHGSITFVDTDGNDVYDVANINTMVYFKAGGVTATTITDTLTGASLNIGDIDTYVYKDGVAVEMTQITAGDYVEVATGRVAYSTVNGNEIMSLNAATSEIATLNVVSTSTVTGKVTAKKTTGIGVDGVVYDYNNYYADLLASDYVKVVSLGDTVEVVLNEKGEVIDIPSAKSSYGDESVEKTYAYLLGMASTGGISESAVVRFMDIEKLQEVRLVTSEDCKINGKKFDFNEVNTVDPTTATSIYYPNGTFKHQLFRYSVNENNEINNIYLAVDHANQYVLDHNGSPTSAVNPDYDPAYAGYDENNFSLDYMKTDAHGYGANIENLYFIKPQTIMLKIPPTPENPKLWVVTTNEEVTTSNSIVTAFADSAIELYDVNEQYVPAVGIKREAGSSNDVTRSGFKNAIRTGIVTNVMDVYDENSNEIRRQVTLAVPTPSGVETRMLVPSDPDLVSVRPMYYAAGNGTVSSQYSTISWNDIQIGDFIVTNVNIAGEVTGFRLYFDHNVLADMDNLTYGKLAYEYATLARTQYKNFDFGYVTKVFGSDGALMNIEGPAGPTAALRKIEAPFTVAGGGYQDKGATMIYYPEKGKFETASVSDIVVGDSVIVHGDCNYTCEVFIIRR